MTEFTLLFIVTTFVLLLLFIGMWIKKAKAEDERWSMEQSLAGCRRTVDGYIEQNKRLEEEYKKIKHLKENGYFYITKHDFIDDFNQKVENILEEAKEQMFKNTKGLIHVDTKFAEEYLSKYWKTKQTRAKARGIINRLLEATEKYPEYLHKKYKNTIKK